LDPIIQIVELLRPHALHRCRPMHGRGDWAVRFPQKSNVVFGLIVAGSCYLDYPDLEQRDLRAGDLLVMNAPPSWMLRQGDRVTPVDFEPAGAAVSASTVSFGRSEAGDLTRIIGGHFSFDTANANLLAELLAPVIIVQSNVDIAWRLKSIIDLINDEVSFDRPGQQLVLDRLLQVLLLETSRNQLGQAATARTGLLSGLADPKIAEALRALHDDVRHNWTVETLAAHAGMSHSAFASRFRERVGVPPIAYLRNWRLALAKDALSYSNRPLADVARASGYASASAFSTAFSRSVGSPPGRMAREGGNRETRDLHAECAHGQSSARQVRSR
jgi:AraC-like DNA-binding protein